MECFALDHLLVYYSLHKIGLLVICPTFFFFFQALQAAVFWLNKANLTLFMP